jgi:putative transcriptional regulator
MTPNHHPGEATLLAYAAGGLGEGLSLVVASHLSFCPECRANVAAGEAVGGSRRRPSSIAARGTACWR